MADQFLYQKKSCATWEISKTAGSVLSAYQLRRSMAQEGGGGDNLNKSCRSPDSEKLSLIGGGRMRGIKEWG